jgi:hypothetical protein
MRHFGVGIDCDRVLLAHISFSFIYNYVTPLEISNPLLLTSISLLVQCIRAGSDSQNTVGVPDGESNRDKTVVPLPSCWTGCLRSKTINWLNMQ